MKIKIIHVKEWKTLAELSHLVFLTKDDIITIAGIEYTVKFCAYDLDKNQYEIIVHD